MSPSSRTRSTRSRPIRPARCTGGDDNPSNPSPPELDNDNGEVFPFVLTTARLTEHHTAGGMSRSLPYLSELQPALTVEVSPELARVRGWSIWGGLTS